jgi:hypothetical protein
MAGLACNLSAFTVIEREGMDFQKSRRPGRAAMAFLAFLTKKTNVNSRLGMTFHTPGRSGVVNAACVAIQAGDLGMRAFQRKDSLMIEIAHTISPVMTFQAGQTVLGCVLLHKAGILATMAGSARAIVYGQKPTRMANITRYRLALIILCMMRQAKGGIYFMIKLLSI